MIGSMRTLPCFSLNKCFIKLSREIDLIIKSCHLLFVVKQLLLIDLFHITMVIVKPLHLCLCLFKRNRFGHQISLQLLILLCDSCAVKLILPPDLINFNILKSL